MYPVLFPNDPKNSIPPFNAKFNVKFSQFKPTKLALNSTTKSRPAQEAPGA